MTKKPAILADGGLALQHAAERDLELHAHVAHAAHTAAGHGGCALVLRRLGHHALGGQHQGRHGGGVLQRGAGDLGRVENAHIQHIAVGVIGGVEAKIALAFKHLVDHHAGLATGVGNDFAQRLFNGTQHNLDASFLVVVVALDLACGLTGTQQGHAAASHNAFFHRSAGSVQGVFDTSLLLLHFHLGGGADLDDGHTTGQLGHALLQLFAVVIRGGFLDLDADLLDARFDVGGNTSTVDDDGVFLAHFDALGLAQIGQRDLFQRQADFFGDDLAAGQDGDVFQHGLATVTKARCLDGHGLEDAADAVDHQGSQRFAVHVFSDDQQRTAGLGHLLQRGQQVADVGDFLVVQQHERVVEHGNLFVLVVDEVGRQIATVELHAFDDVELVFQALAVFDGDHAFLAHLVHRLSDDLADIRVAVGRDRADLRDFLGVGARLGGLLQLFDQRGDRFVDAALEVHRVHAGGHILHAFAHDGLGQHGGGGGAVTGVVGGLGGDFLDHLRAHVLQLVLQLDFLGHGHTVLGHGGGAERALEHHIAALGAQGRLDSVGENVHAFHHAGAGVRTKNHVFCSH